MVAQLAYSTPREVLDQLTAEANTLADEMSLVTGCGRIDDDAYVTADAKLREADAARQTIMEAVTLLGGSVEDADAFLSDLFGYCIEPSREVLKAWEVC